MEKGDCVRQSVKSCHAEKTEALSCQTLLSQAVCSISNKYTFLFYSSAFFYILYKVWGLVQDIASIVPDSSGPSEKKDQKRQKDERRITTIKTREKNVYTTKHIWTCNKARMKKKTAHGDSWGTCDVHVSNKKKAVLECSTKYVWKVRE